MHPREGLGIRSTELSTAYRCASNQNYSNLAYIRWILKILHDPKYIIYLLGRAGLLYIKVMQDF